MNTGDLVTFGELATLIKVNPTTISDIVRCKGIKPKRVPRNGNAKGLDPPAVKVIRDALRPVKSA